jgi:hypothetical protein
LTLFAAAASAIGRGLKFVYVSNLAGQMGELSNTRCLNCRAVIIERFDYQTVRNRMADGGKCPECAAEIPGVWR